MGATSPGIAKIALPWTWHQRSEEHTSELQSQSKLVCRLLLEKKKYHPSQARFGCSGVVRIDLLVRIIRTRAAIRTGVELGKRGCDAWYGLGAGFRLMGGVPGR